MKRFTIFVVGFAFLNPALPNPSLASDRSASALSAGNPYADGTGGLWAKP